MLKIESIERELVLIPKTRKMQREIDEVLYSGLSISEVQNQDTLPALNMTKALELSVKLQFGLSSDELDSLSDEDYTLLSAELNKKK